MGWSSFLKSPKKEEQEVPDSNIVNGVVILDDFEGFFGLGEEENFQLDNNMYDAQLDNNMYDAQLEWDFMDLNDFSITETNKKKEEEEEEDEEEEEAFGSVLEACFFKKEEFCRKNIRTQKFAFEEDDYGSVENVSLNLNLNYQEVLDAWSGRGSLWADESSLNKSSYGSYMGEVPVMEEERTRREACVLRYKEKRQSRLFSKKIRYQVRKLNADKRPRIKGRFVKTVS